MRPPVAVTVTDRPPRVSPRQLFNDFAMHTFLSVDSDPASAKARGAGSQPPGGWKGVKTNSKTLPLYQSAAAASNASGKTAAGTAPPPADQGSTSKRDWKALKSYSLDLPKSFVAGGANTVASTATLGALGAETEKHVSAAHFTPNADKGQLLPGDRDAGKARGGRESASVAPTPLLVVSAVRSDHAALRA